MLLTYEAAAAPLQGGIINFKNWSRIKDTAKPTGTSQTSQSASPARIKTK